MLDVVEGLVALAAFAAVLKAMAPLATADTHIYDILCTKAAVVNNWMPEDWRLPESKLPDCTEPSFNARLYLIMGVFKELEASSLTLYYATTAGPAAALTCGLVLLRCGSEVLLRRRPASSTVPRGRSGSSRSEGGSNDAGQDIAASSAAAAGSSDPTAAGLRKRKGGKAEPKTELKARSKEQESKGATGAEAVDPEDLVASDAREQQEHAALLFFVMQFLLFLLLGFLVNRLRVAFGPPMMVLAASCLGPRVLPLRLLGRGRLRVLALLGLAGVHIAYLAFVAQKLPCPVDTDGTCSQLSAKVTSDGDLVDLMEWMNEHLSPKLPLLASMNLAGTMRAFIVNPMVIHPQFESENLRKRVQRGYELYHCGTEESFVQTMKNLSAKVVIFEHARCFFTPYILDDRRKNCIKGKHKPEEQLCLKLYASRGRFKLLFMNGGYGVFKVQKAEQKAVEEDEDLTPAEIGQALEAKQTWSSYVERCAKQQGESCGPRLAEAVATWLHGLKRPKVASVLRQHMMDRFPNDAVVAYHMGRYLDYELKQASKAGKYYEQAALKMPNNALFLKEYLLWLDMEAKDQKKIRSILEDRSGWGKGGGTPLLELEVPGTAELLCEAAASAKDVGLSDFSKKLWKRSMELAPLSKCIQQNWGLIHRGQEFDKVFSLRDKVYAFMSVGVTHEVGSHHGPAVRFVEPRRFALEPRREAARASPQ